MGNAEGNMFAKSGSCPEVSCVSMTTSVDDYDCAGPFDVDLGTNIYANSDQSRIFYFHVPSFRWVCTSNVFGGVVQNYCSAQGFAFTLPESGHGDLTAGDTISMQWYGNQQFDISCIGQQPTTSTTKTPTSSPIATDIPTSNPSQSIATDSPSKNPTVNVVDNPTSAPIASPTFQPTKVGDTKHPTMSPSQSEDGQNVSTQPTNSPIVNDESSANTISGVDNNIFYLLISIVFLCGACILIICCFMLYRNKRLGKQTFDKKVSGHGDDWR